MYPLVAPSCVYIVGKIPRLSFKIPLKSAAVFFFVPRFLVVSLVAYWPLEGPVCSFSSSLSASLDRLFMNFITRCILDDRDEIDIWREEEMKGPNPIYVRGLFMSESLLAARRNFRQYPQ